VPLNGCKRISLGRRGEIAVFNLEGRFYATDDRCTHGAASLSRGEIADGQIICPLHFGSFDIATGAPVDPPCDVPLRIYALRIEGAELFIEDDI
jgi:nitrite reductase/ring-hydroxylating ferredoxin subunit